MSAYVTGIGAYSAALGEMPAIWRRVREGTPFVRAAAEEPAGGEPSFIRFASAATRACLRDARVTADDLCRLRVGVVIASSKGDLGRLPERRIGSVGDVEALLPSGAASAVARALRLDGPVLCPVAACASGAAAIGAAMRLLDRDACDLVLAGASEGELPPLLTAGYERMGLVSRNGCRPFDRRRGGFVPCAGAVVLALQKRPSASPRAEVVTVKLSAEAHSAVDPEPGGETLRATLAAALDDAAVGRGEAVYINAHGTGTTAGDAAEAEGLAAALDGRASVTVGSTKGATGHWLGAAGALEAALCVRALSDSFIPPTAGFTEPDPALPPLPGLGTSGPAGLDAAVSLSAGFGGHVGVVVLRPVEA